MVDDAHASVGLIGVVCQIEKCQLHDETVDSYSLGYRTALDVASMLPTLPSALFVLLFASVPLWVAFIHFVAFLHVFVSP